MGETDRELFTSLKLEKRYEVVALFDDNNDLQGHKEELLIGKDRLPATRSRIWQVEEQTPSKENLDAFQFELDQLLSSQLEDFSNKLTGLFANLVEG